MTFDTSLVSATQVASASGRQYHIGLAPGEVAPNIVLVGDPARAARVASLFDVVPTARQNREYVSYTGHHRGLPVTVMGTGIGTPATEIAVIELLNCVDQPVIIRCGTCGGLQPEIQLGDLVVSQGALRLEDTTAAYVEPAYPAIAHYQVVTALLQAALEIAAPHHLGLTATASGFYGAQGRSALDLPLRTRERIDSLRGQKVANLEMEAACVLTLASLAQVRAGVVCAVYARRTDNVFIAPDVADHAETRAITASLRALAIVREMDRARGQARYWTPLVSTSATNQRA